MYEKCKTWAAQCLKPNYLDYMRLICPETCGYCKGNVSPTASVDIVNIYKNNDCNNDDYQIMIIMKIGIITMMIMMIMVMKEVMGMMV